MADTGARKQDFTVPQTEEKLQSDFGLGKALDVLRRRIWVFLLTAGSVLLLVALSTMASTRLYTAVAQIEIDPRDRNQMADLETVMAGTPPDTAIVETQTAILQSRALAGDVVDTRNLVEDREFAKPPRKGIVENIGEFMFGPPRDARAREEAERKRMREEAVDALIHSLRVNRVGMTYIVNIAITTRDPEKSAELADLYAERFIARQVDHKVDQLERANEVLSSRLEKLREEVLGKERVTEQYRAQSGLLEAEGSTLTEQAMAQLNMELINSRAVLAERQARLRTVQAALASGGAADTSAEVLNSPTIAALKGQLAEAQRERSEAAVKYGPRHPSMLSIDQETAGLQAQIQGEVQKIVAGLSNEVEVQRRRIASVEESLSGQRTNLASNNVGAVKLREYQREAEASRTLYEGLLNRVKRLAEQSGIELPDARIVSRATPPLSPSWPKVPLNLMIGLVLGAALGAAAVMIVELMERSLRSPEDVQRRLGLPCLGAVPYLDKNVRLVDGELVAPENFILKRPVSAFGEALRSLRASVFFANPDRKVKVLAVTSALPDEGKTTTSIGLARISALAGSKTVLVDCDLRRRSATHSLGIEAERGLTEVLFRTAKLEDVIQRDPSSGVDVVPLAQAEFTPRDLFGSEAMHQLIEQLRQKYDMVILDTAPVLPLADTRVLSPLADSVLLVVRWGRTPANIVQSAVDQLRSHNAKIAGVALDAVETGLFARMLYDRPDYYSELYQTYYIR